MTHLIPRRLIGLPLFCLVAVGTTDHAPQWVEWPTAPARGVIEAFATARRSVDHGDTIRMVAPTGQAERDRPAVQAAFDAARPGDVVLFAAGTYLLGRGARLTVPDVTVLGHRDGTTLRGCDPAAFDIDESQLLALVFGCTGLHVQAERQTIRGLTLEHMWHGIIVGPFPATAEEMRASGGMMTPFPVGGQRIEGNTFRATPNGMRMLGVGDEVSIVRNNDFIDTFHAIGVYGAPVHFLENRVRVEDPRRVPTSGHPGSAILISAVHTDCSGHVVAGNTVQGYPGAIYVFAYPGHTCRGVEIRDNRIRVARVVIPPGWVIPVTDGDSTMVDVPITLAPMGEGESGQEGEVPAGRVEEITIRGNEILGAEGIGILLNGHRNRIVDNHISDIRRRVPFPGNSWDPSLATWEVGNGAGIWIAPGARENELSGNVFERIAGPSITVEGTGNRVELLGAGDTVSDRGRENRITRRPPGP